MKVQLTILKKVFKKCYKFVLVFMLFSFSYLLAMKLSKGIDYNDIKILLGYIDLNNFNFLGILLLIYQYALTIYFTYLFYSFEIREGKYNILLLANTKKLFIEKLLFQLLIVFSFRVIFSSFLIFFFNNLENYQSFLLNNIIIYLSISLLASIFYNHIHNKLFYLFILVSICFVEAIFYNSIFIFNILINIILVFYDLFIFNFKSFINRSI